MHGKCSKCSNSSETRWNPDPNKSSCINNFSCVCSGFRAILFASHLQCTVQPLALWWQWISQVAAFPADLLLSLHFNTAVHRDACLPPLQLPRTSEVIYWKMEIGEDWYAISLLFTPSWYDSETRARLLTGSEVLFLFLIHCNKQKKLNMYQIFIPNVNLYSIPI